MKEIFEENWCCLQCGQCKYFKVNADREDSTCKRLDHKHIQFAVPWFKSYDCGQFSGTVCKDFEPSDTVKWLKEHWVSYEDYYDGDKPTGTISLVLDGNTAIRYKVLKEDFVNGTFINKDGSLKWIEKEFYRKVKKSKKNPIGYELVHIQNEKRG